MKSASTAARTDEILYDIVGGYRSNPLAELEYYDVTTASWIKMDDVTSMSFSLSNDNKIYGKFSLVPGCGDMEASFDNTLGKYSPGSGNKFDGILIRNRKVRAQIGYKLSGSVGTSVAHSASSYTKLYHTKIVSSTIKNDISSGFTWLALPGITSAWTFYGGQNYGSGTYQPEGYYVSSIIDFTLFDVETLTALNMTSDNTKIDMYYRNSNDYTQLSSNLASFTFLGSTSVGANSFALPSITDRLFQFAIVFRTGVWGTGTISAMSISYNTQAEYFTQGENLIDEPTFHSAYGDYTASFSARDFFKKAFETTVTCPTYAVAVDVAQILRDVADRCGIPHNDGSELIADTTYDVAISDDLNFKDTAAIDIFDEVMLYLNSKNTNYRLERYGEYLRLSLKSTTVTSADWIADYRDTMLSIDKSYVSDKLIQRVTVLNQDEIVDPEIQLATDTYITAQNDTDLSWSNDSMYLRIVITGDDIFTLNYIDLAAKKINFDITPVASAGCNTTVTIYGDELKNARTYYFGESVYVANQTNSDGFTQKIINRLCQSDADCRALAEGIVSRFGNPNFQVSVKLPCNPLLELGDRVLLWEKYTYSNTIYRIDAISIDYSADGASFYMTLTLTDLGYGITNFIWDANGVNAGANDLSYDSGLLWDQDLGVTALEDTTDYSSTKPVRFS